MAAEQPLEAYGIEDGDQIDVTMYARRPHFFFVRPTNFFVIIKPASLLWVVLTSARIFASLQATSWWMLNFGVLKCKKFHA
jgi:hypothetical protein